MASHSVGRTKVNAGCDWVRARLPLWVGDRASRTDEKTDGGELSALEHRRIERHVDQCDTCSRYRLDLEGALGALTAAAAQLPVEPEAPSVWPALNRRIQDFHPPVPSRLRRLARGFTGPWVRGLSEFTTDQPLRRAWAHDDLRAIFTIRRTARLEFNPRIQSVLGLGMVASLFIAVTAVFGVGREWANAQYTIKTNASPLADRGASSGGRVIEQEPEPSSSDDRETQQELVQADVARPVETPGGGANSTTEFKPAPPARFGYDLERGIPMPPDVRESKPVY